MRNPQLGTTKYYKNVIAANDYYKIRKTARPN